MNKKPWYVIALYILFWPITVSIWIWKQDWTLRNKIIAISVLLIVLFIFPKQSPNSQSVKKPTCIGPDGKEIRLSQKACEEFNRKWKEGESAEVVVDTEKQQEDEQRPNWYGKEYTITTIDQQEDMEDYDVGTVNAWLSFEDRSNVLFQLNNGDIITLIGYDNEHDYCEVESRKLTGWIACGWIENLPEEMTDYWVE